jgi:tetratricopeptide (TPR) repeat protein
MKTRRATPEARAERLAELRRLSAHPQRRADAEPALKRFLRDYEDDVIALRGVSELLIGLGAVGEAEKTLRSALVRCGPDPNLLIPLSHICSGTNRRQEALAALRRAIELAPNDAEPRLRCGQFCVAHGQIPQAIEMFRAARARKPGDYEIEAGLGQALQRWGRAGLAIRHYEVALAVRPDAVDCRCAMGVAQALIGDYESALSSLREVRRTHPEHQHALGAEADVLASLGRREEALALLEPYVSRPNVHPSLATAFARIAAEAGRVADAIALCRRVVTAAGARDSDRATVLFSLGGLYEKCGDFDAAFDAFRRGNELSGATEFDDGIFVRYVDQMIAAFEPAKLGRYRRGSDRSELPLFIVGMPRSGTSLVEQILASHPQVFGAGELPDIGQMLLSLPAAMREGAYPACLERAGQEVIDRFAAAHLSHLRELGGENTRVTDKMPGNFQHLGLIWLLLPGARVIHCRRDPIDTCLGCYTTMFSAAHVYARDLTHLGRFYREYERLMAFWKGALDLPILDVQYEDFVDDPEPHVRRLIEFCGLPWDDGCLRFHESKRVVRTASIDQVRKPIYKTSVNRSARYGAHLDPLRAALGTR